jgi:hypothetical protein
MWKHQMKNPRLPSWESLFKVTALFRRIFVNFKFDICIYFKCVDLVGAVDCTESGTVFLQH